MKNRQNNHLQYHGRIWKKYSLPPIDRLLLMSDAPRVISGIGTSKTLSLLDSQSKMQIGTNATDTLRALKFNVLEKVCGLLNIGSFFRLTRPATFFPQRDQLKAPEQHAIKTLLHRYHSNNEKLLKVANKQVKILGGMRVSERLYRSRIPIIKCFRIYKQIWHINKSIYGVNNTNNFQSKTNAFKGHIKQTLQNVYNNEQYGSVKPIFSETIPFNAMSAAVCLFRNYEIYREQNRESVDVFSTDANSRYGYVKTVFQPLASASFQCFMKAAGAAKDTLHYFPIDFFRRSVTRFSAGLILSGQKQISSMQVFPDECHAQVCTVSTSLSVDKTALINKLFDNFRCKLNLAKTYRKYTGALSRHLNVLSSKAGSNNNGAVSTYQRKQQVGMLQQMFTDLQHNDMHKTAMKAGIGKQMIEVLKSEINNLQKSNHSDMRSLLTVLQSLQNSAEKLGQPGLGKVAIQPLSFFGDN